jgi:acetyl-CoA carboxylase biotin carboxyl carrier protein
MSSRTAQLVVDAGREAEAARPVGGAAEDAAGRPAGDGSTTRMAKLDIDISYVAQLAELLQRTGLTEIELGQGDTRIRVAKQITLNVDMTAAMGQTGGGPVAAAPAPAAEAAAPVIDPAHPGLVASPMVGTVYLAPEPGAPAFVAVGQEVREGATLLIIEAMKVMNSIRAHKAGRITRIFVENASPVEYGEPLMLIE